jgi:hypothetical protein
MLTIYKGTSTGASSAIAEFFGEPEHRFSYILCQIPKSITLDSNFSMLVG